MTVNRTAATLFQEWLFENYPEYRRDRTWYSRPRVRTMWEMFRVGYDACQEYYRSVD